MHCRPQESKSKTLQSRSRGSKRASAVHDHVRGSRLGARPLGATVTEKKPNAIRCAVLHIDGHRGLGPCFHWDNLSRARRVGSCRSCRLGDVVLHPLGLEVVSGVERFITTSASSFHFVVAPLPQCFGYFDGGTGSRWRSRWYDSVLFEIDDLLDDRRGTRRLQPPLSR